MGSAHVRTPSLLLAALVLLGSGCAETEALPGSATPSALADAAFRSLKAGHYGEWRPFIMPHAYGGLTDEELAVMPPPSVPPTGAQPARIQDRFDYVAGALRALAPPADWRVDKIEVGRIRDVGDGRVACVATLTVRVGSSHRRQIVIGCTRTLGRWYSNHGVVLLKE